MVGSHGKSIFNLIGNFQTFFQGGCLDFPPFPQTRDRACLCTVVGRRQLLSSSQGTQGQVTMGGSPQGLLRFCLLPVPAVRAPCSGLLALLADKMGKLCSLRPHQNQQSGNSPSLVISVKNAGTEGGILEDTRAASSYGDHL